MLELSDVDENVSVRLDPLRQILSKKGLLVAALPKEAGTYSTPESGGISVMVPQVTGTVPTMQGTQEIIILIIVRLVLPKRYQEDETETNVIEFVADKIVELLLGFNPFKAGTQAMRSLYLQSYDLLEPNAGQWEAELRFQCSKVLTYAYAIDNDDNTALNSVQLFASKTLSDLDAVLISQIIPPI